EHVLDAVHLLLDGRGDGVGDHLGVGPRVDGGHLDGRRRDLGILRDRQLRQGDNADDDEDNRQHRGEDRPVNEKVRDHGSLRLCFPGESARWCCRYDFDFFSASALAVPVGRVGMGTRSGRTSMPGRTRCTPLTITNSPALSPAPGGKMRSSPWSRPGVTGRYSALFCWLTINRYFWPWSMPMAESTTSRPWYCSPIGRRTRADWPRVSSPSS